MTRSSTVLWSRGRSESMRVPRVLSGGPRRAGPPPPEGGAHQSIITPSVGLEQPRCVAWEPAFGQDLEWTLLHALSMLGRPTGRSARVLSPHDPSAGSGAGGDPSGPR